jgi:hypothetical protein
MEVTVHRICYPITEFVLHQVCGSFGGVVEHIPVIGGTDVVLVSMVLDSVEAAADAYRELHGRNIYDGCCQMQIKWGLPTQAARGAHERASMVALTVVPFIAASTAVVASAPAASTRDTPVAAPPATAPAPTTTSSIVTTSAHEPPVCITPSTILKVHLDS